MTPPPPPMVVVITIITINLSLYIFIYFNNFCFPVCVAGCCRQRAAPTALLLGQAEGRVRVRSPEEGSPACAMGFMVATRPAPPQARPGDPNSLAASLSALQQRDVSTLPFSPGELHSPMPALLRSSQ